MSEPGGEEKMLNRIRLSYKLAVMVIVPVVGLVVLAGIDMSRRRSVSSEMAILEQLTNLATSAHELVNALHSERSLSAGALTASGAVSEEVRLQYITVDKLVEALLAQREELGDEKLLEILGIDFKGIESTLAKLPEHRLKTSSGELTTAAVVSFYNDVTKQLLPIISMVSKVSSNAQVKTLLISLDLLAQLKEAADLERAALNVAFTADEISPGLQQAVVGMVARQEALDYLFTIHAPATILDQYKEQLSEETLEEINMLRLEGIDGVGLPSLGVNPEQWMAASSARINAMVDVEVALSSMISETVERLRSASRRAALLGLVLVLITVVPSVLLSAYVGRGVTRSLAEASSTIRRSVDQITSSVQQFTASTGETASAVSETSTTVDELRQTSEAATDKAKDTSEAAEQSRGASDNAQQAALQGNSAMEAIRQEVEGIAERIVELSEKNAQISNIVENVDAIAQQSNLLAVNASIEAAKAGEHGKGFAVVAGEVKTLAERSKEATDQIRAILGEIQRFSNAAVMVTEQGVKRVDEGAEIIDELSKGIASLGVTIQSNAEAASQISLISNQQLAGIEQITEALRSIEQAANDNAAGAHQLERAASQLSLVSEEIARIVQGVDDTSDGR